MKVNYKILIKILLFAFILLFSINNSYSQFGKNKVQYKYFDWKYLQTKHFDIYFYQEGYPLAEFAAAVAESSLVSIINNTEFHIANRIPIIIFNSHNEFQQNNIIDEFLPEGVGGVTELFKNRALIPFEGNYEQFRHTIHHELVHAFMNDVFYGGSVQNIIAKNITLVFPMWFSEGMCEYLSLDGLDKGTDEYMRVGIVNDFIPPLEYIYGYLSYRAGQSFFAWISSYYGEYKIAELFRNIKTFGDVEVGFKETFKLDIQEISEKWLRELKKNYWTDITDREEVTEFSKQLTDARRTGGFYNISPVISPQGDKFVFISNRDDFFDVFLADVNTGQVIDKIIEGNTTANFEELQVLTPGVSWSPDGSKIAISVKAGDQDAIFLVDINSGRETRLPVSLNSISYVEWSPVNNKLALVGTNNKQSDIYIYDLNTKKLDNLTNDIFSDLNPGWSPDGKYIYFTSDRADYTDPALIPKDFKMWEHDLNTKNLYKIDVTTKKITRETNSRNVNDSYAQFGPDTSKYLYVSDISGISNIYMKYTDSSGTVTDKPITNSLNPIDQITLSKDGKKLLFVSLHNGAYEIFSINNPFEKNLYLNSLKPTRLVTEKYLKPDSTGISKSDSLNLPEDSTENNINKTIITDSSYAITSDSVLYLDSGKTNLTNNNDSLLISDSTFTESKIDSSKIYGEDIKINLNKRKGLPDSLSKAIKTDSIDYQNNPNFQVAENLNPDRTFKVNNYKVRFSPDYVYGNALYSNFYGLQGYAQLSLSDMMGNHRLYFLSSMVIDFQNSDFAVYYFNFPHRIDYGFGAFHTARFVIYNKGHGDNLYRYRNIGMTFNASYPLSRFKRFDASLSLLRVSKENLDDSSEPIERKYLATPSISFVHDNTLPGLTAPIKGSRYNISLLASPKFLKDGIGFSSFLFDFRRYFKLADDFTLAMRWAGGASFGPNPQRFYIGGTENWINYNFENRTIPISNIEEFIFSQPGFPLRGFNYDRAAGSKYTLGNIEFRYPIIKYLILGILPIGFQDIMAVTFLDAGMAWSDNSSLKPITKIDGRYRTKDLLIGMGFGTRQIFLGLPLKFDIAWNYNLQKFSPPFYYFSLGLDF